MDNKLGDHDARIRKIESDIKMLKLSSKPASSGTGVASAGDTNNGPADMSQLPLQDIFDAINQMGDDLRKDMDDQFVTKKTFGDHKL